MNQFRLILGLLALTFVAACAPESATMRGIDIPPVPDVTPAGDGTPKLLPREDAKPPVVAPEELQWITLDGGKRDEFSPKTDILFVIDDSDSMKEEQENISRNIDKFVAGIRAQRYIDYHIGVVTVWDSSERYISKAVYGQGELRKVRDAKGRELEARFINRSNDKLLARTLKVGVTPFEKGGPEREEIFSPIAAALQKTGRGATNEGFFREDAHLVVVLVTDADDDSNGLLPSQMAEELFNFKGGRKDLVSVYGVLVAKNDPDSVKDYALKIHPKYHPECFETVAVKTKKGTKSEVRDNGVCKGFGPDRLEEFLLIANSGRLKPDQIRAKQFLKLNQKDFGKDLERIGSDVAIRTQEKEIPLSARPRQAADGSLLLRVRFGSQADLQAGRGQVIPQSLQSGWSYDPVNVLVRISGQAKLNYTAGARFAVDLVPYGSPTEATP